MRDVRSGLLEDNVVQRELVLHRPHELELVQDCQGRGEEGQ